MLKSPAALAGIVSWNLKIKCTVCLFRFTWINDLNDKGKLLITCFCLASVNCGPRTVVAGVVGEYCSVRVLFLRVLAQVAQAQRIGKIITASKNKKSKYGKLYFVEHFSE